MLKGRSIHSMPRPCRSPAMPCRKGFRMSFPFNLHSAAVSSHLPCRAHAIHDHAVLLKATAHHDRRETVCGLLAGVRLLPATTQSSTQVDIRRIPISDAGGHCETKQFAWTRKRVVAAHYKKDHLLHCWITVRIFPATMRTFTKDTALSEHGRGTAWHV